MLYGLKTSPQLTTWQDMLAVWQAADQMAVFHSAWNFDHFYPINVPDTTGPCMEAWTTLTALAQELPTGGQRRLLQSLQAEMGREIPASRVSQKLVTGLLLLIGKEGA